MFKHSKTPPEPRSARRPHPNPRVEARMQQVISLRRACARAERQLDQNQQEASAMRSVIAKHPTWDGHSTRRRQITQLETDTDRLTGELADLHKQIKELLDGLSDDELLWLESDQDHKGQ